MMLRYSDGRGDIPISHWHYDGQHYPQKQSLYRGPAPRSRPQTPHRYSHDRSRSVAGHRPVTPGHHYHGHDGYHHSEKFGQPISPEDPDYESAPEDIQVLPADPNAKPQRVTGSYRPRRSSEPFRARSQSQPSRDSDVYDSPPPRYVSNTLNVPAVTYSHSQRIHDPYDHHHPSHSHSRGNRPPPSIVYAPGNNRNTDHYAPPTIVYASHKAPGMNHAVSSPAGSGFPQYPRIVNAPYPPVHNHRVPVQEEQRYGPKGPRPREDIPRSHTPISEAASGESGSTYYVLPSAGQKVKVLVGPEPSLYNGSASTKSVSMPRTPDSVTGRIPRRPLFSRILSFASDLSNLSRTSRSSRKNLYRRHSVDISTRSQSRDRR
ncbi:hypothetical protein F5J12DRAFT_400632 [Pisolithus orientalis]|uniref:uncharacterized protein n=1 Tax=Pisolithus orientalis TaxID=936130 RepID=UPI00222584E8|nr:uncharacterized protein F5J12DRAFT_400632 [Pisolithus orientalis]KAI6028893.1 hypothetical protein F5J12DRAFT_400632 [Pisolithus orientalis]